MRCRSTPHFQHSPEIAQSPPIGPSLSLLGVLAPRFNNYHSVANVSMPWPDDSDVPSFTPRPTTSRASSLSLVCRNFPRYKDAELLRDGGGDSHPPLNDEGTKIEPTHGHNSLRDARHPAKRVPRALLIACRHALQDSFRSVQARTWRPPFRQPSTSFSPQPVLLVAQEPEPHHRDPDSPCGCTQLDADGPARFPGMRALQDRALCGRSPAPPAPTPPS
ncbi:hypothetical protein C8R47DRAFT_1154423 [Mycena vitilis]|nr:hypothetical protein C8R47DRAFT_1154423 [Mycena vitilis]